MHKLNFPDFLPGTWFKHRGTGRLFELVRTFADGDGEYFARLVSLSDGREFSVPAVTLTGIYREAVDVELCKWPAGRLAIGSVSIDTAAEGVTLETKRERGRPRKPNAQVTSYFGNPSKKL